MRIVIAAATIAAMTVAVPARADDLTTKVYGATLEPGLTEVEIRYGRLTGGEADGEDGLLIETAHHFSSRFYGGLETLWSREPGGERRLGSVGFEGIATLGRLAGVDAAVLGEYEANRDAPDVFETKLLFEKRAGEFDGRLNLVAERALARGAPVEFGYAASADVEAVGELRLGAMAIGELGTSKRLTLRKEHFAGPIAKFEIEHLPGQGELGIETGYLFALGEARDESKGQLRLLLEYEFRF